MKFITIKSKLSTNAKNGEPKMGKDKVALAICFSLIVVVVVAILILQQGGGGILPGPKAHFTIVSREARTAIEGLDYVAYVDVTVKNDGDGGGSTRVYVKVTQGGNYWQKDTSVYLDAGESKTVTLRFSEIGFWTTNPLSYNVWLG